MRKNRISEIVGNINEKYVNEAAVYMVKAKADDGKWIRWCALAACMMFLIPFGVGVMSNFSIRESVMHGDVVEDREPIIVTIEEWKDEGFTARVVDGDVHKFLEEGETVLINFNEDTKINGSDFRYDVENPNARDCGLPLGTIVQIFFKAVDYKSDGMAHSIHAMEIVPLTALSSIDVATATPYSSVFAKHTEKLPMAGFR